MSGRLADDMDWAGGANQQTKAGARKPVLLALVSGDAALHAAFQRHLIAAKPDWQLEMYLPGASVWSALRASPPQVVMVEQTLPDGCGLEWLRHCKRQRPGLPVVLLAKQGCPKTLWATLLAGAQGYYVKGGNEAGLVALLRKVLAGKLALCDQAERLLPQAFAMMRQRAVNQWGLSRREEEVMMALCRKLSNKEIAGELGLSSATVHAHLDRIFKKLNVHNRAEAIQKFSNHVGGG